MQFTGERYIPEVSGEIRLEHLHRYMIAKSIANGKAVADIACGEGYGSALLSTVANSVTAIDISDEAITQAQKHYSNHSNITFIAASAHKTGLPDCTFDLIVSFETIEHLADQEGMLSEFSRLLTQDGMLLISSPNKPVYSKDRPANEFHINELDFTEFDNLLKKHFKKSSYYGQRLEIGTVFQSLNRRVDQFKAYGDDDLTVTDCAPVMNAPVYYVALCSNGGNELPDLSASVLYPASFSLLEHYVGFAKWAKNQDIELSHRDSNIRHYQSEVERLKFDRDKVNHEIVRAEAQLELLKDLLLSDDLSDL